MQAQMGFDDYDAGFKSIDVERRLSELFPKSELLGYSLFFNWSNSVDYWVAIKQEMTTSVYYSLRYVTLNYDGQAHRGYINSGDFTHHAFGTKKWIWRSVEDRETVFEVAAQNHQEQIGGYNSSYDQNRKQKVVPEKEVPEVVVFQEDSNQLSLF